MKKFMSRLVGGLVALFVSVSVCAAPAGSQSELDSLNNTLKDCSDQTIDSVPTGAQKIVYVNGVLVEDWYAAKQASDRMKVVLCSTNTDPATAIAGSHHHSTAAKTFVFQVVYNPIGWDSSLGGTMGASTVAQDVKELFQLKAGEEYYLPSDGNGGLACPSYLCSPHDGPQSNSALSSTDLSGLVEIMTRADHMETSSRGASGTWSVSNELETNDNTFADQMSPTKKVVYKLSLMMQYPGPTIVVAHSQGNLIANLAYAYAKYNLATFSGDGTTDIVKKVRIVNVANTSAVSINNLSLKHDGDGVVKTLLGEGAPLVWWRTTPRADNVTFSYHKSFYIDPSTMDAPIDTGSANQLSAVAAAKLAFENSIGDTSALADDVRVVVQSVKDYASGYLQEHYMVETYLSDRMASVKDGQTRGVNYFAPCQSFRDFFEDLVYAAASSLNTANLTPLPEADWQTYLSADFRVIMPETFVTGNTQQTNDGVWQMILRGTGTFGVRLPADQTAVRVKAHMLFTASANTNTRFAYKMYSQDGSIAQGLYLSMRYNSPSACANATSAYSLDGASGSWQCGTELPLDVARLATVGPVMFTAQYDRRDYTLRISIVPDDGGPPMGGVVSLTPSQYNNSRANFSFSPGAQSVDSMIRIYSLDVLTYKAP